MAASNPTVKSVCLKNKGFPNLVDLIFRKEFAYVSVKIREKGFKFSTQHRFDKSRRKITPIGKVGVVLG